MKIFTNNEYIIMKVLNKVSQNKYYILLMRYIFISSKNLILINRNNEYARQ